MPILIDTSALVAAANPRETHHLAAAASLKRAELESALVPVTILTETLSFARSRYGLSFQRRLWSAVRESEVEVLCVDSDLLDHARQIDERYADVGFGFADCTLLATCEQQRTARILTFDRRLAAYKPTFAPGLELLP